MKCDKQCSYRTPYGYCSVTQCQRNLGTTYAEPRHLKGRKKMIVSTTDRPNIYIKSKWLDEKKDQYANVFIDDKPLIRCKDCKYWEGFTLNVPPFHYCGRLFQNGNTESIGFYMEADDFCSRGERRGEEEC